MTSTKTACAHCDDGGVILYEGRPGYERIARCLCLAGQRRYQTGIPQVDRVFSAPVLQAMWPMGLPAQTETLCGRLEVGGIPPGMWNWTLRTYREKFGAGQAIQARIQRATEWIALAPAQRADVVLAGSHGTGKTGLVVAIAHALAERHEPFTFLTASRLFAEWRDTYRAERGESELQFLDRYEAAPLLCLDDVTQTTDSSYVEQSLMTLIRSRHGRSHATILTLNVDEITPTTLSALLGPGLYDSLKERAEWWPCMGKSHRTRPVLPLLETGELT